jgi:hypothetical protein
MIIRRIVYLDLGRAWFALVVGTNDRALRSGLQGCDFATATLPLAMRTMDRCAQNFRAPPWQTMHAARSLALALAVAVMAACGPTATPTGTTGPTAPETASTATAAAPTSGSFAPEPSAGFAFDAESIIGYYETLGYTCSAVQPSAKAVGYSYRSCQLVDTDGRTRVVGIVTDPADDVADAYASVAGAGTETILDPAVAFEPLAAFLGATLGKSQGESLLPWLASHLGDAYVTTTIGELTVATYTPSADDHSKLYVEIANRAYLEAAAPSPS